VTGLVLFNRLVAAATARGVPLRRFVNPLRGVQASTTFLKQLKGAKRPTATTIERVQALIEGRCIPPAPTRVRLPQGVTLPRVVVRPRHDPPVPATDQVVVGRHAFGAARSTAQQVAGAVESEQRAAAIATGLPSFQQGLRQVVADWPDQWARIRAIATDLGLLPGETFRRVIAAGLTCLEEGDD
jgi:hypothetical protein